MKIEAMEDGTITISELTVENFIAMHRALSRTDSRDREVLEDAELGADISKPSVEAIKRMQKRNAEVHNAFHEFFTAGPHPSLAREI